MGFQYANVLFGLLFGAAFVVLNVAVLNRLLRPRGNDPDRDTTYECGEPAIGSAWVRFDMRFYAVALVFLIFEVEVAFLFPWAVAYNQLVEWSGLFAYVEAFIFVAILGVGLVYVWIKGDLDWVKSTLSQGRPDVARSPQPPRSGESIGAEPVGVATSGGKVKS